MKDIKVTYDGEFPNACRGELTISINGDIIYQKKSCTRSTGGVSFDEDMCETIHSGDLDWDHAQHFTQEIQDAVEEVLSEISVCCGGCV